MNFPTITSFYLFIFPFRNNFSLKAAKITILSQLSQILTSQLTTVHYQSGDIVIDTVVSAD